LKNICFYSPLPLGEGLGVRIVNMRMSLVTSEVPERSRDQ